MNRMTVYDQTRLCFKVTTHQEPGRSMIQELGIYEDIHEEEIKKARNITDIRDLYFTKGAKLDPYWENLGKPKTERSGWNKYDDHDPETWPEDGSWVLWQHKRGGMKVLRWKQDAQNHFYPDPDMWKIEDVVAWMPLPEPYKTESEDKA